MAGITLTELVELVERDPRYRSQWRQGTDGATSIYVTFTSAEAVSGSTSEVFDGADGSSIVLDLGPDGEVRGLEIT